LGILKLLEGWFFVTALRLGLILPKPEAFLPGVKKPGTGANTQKWDRLQVVKIYERITSNGVFRKTTLL
jgi:hypothetical protein